MKLSAILDSQSIVEKISIISKDYGYSLTT